MKTTPESFDEACDAWQPDLTPQPPKPIDIQQVIYALERARDRLEAEANAPGPDGFDYSREFPSEDAERMREAITLLQGPKSRPLPVHKGDGLLTPNRMQPIHLLDLLVDRWPVHWRTLHGLLHRFVVCVSRRTPLAIRLFKLFPSGHRHLQVNSNDEARRHLGPLPTLGGRHDPLDHH